MAALGDVNNCLVVNAHKRCQWAGKPAPEQSTCNNGPVASITWHPFSGKPSKHNEEGSEHPTQRKVEAHPAN